MRLFFWEVTNVVGKITVHVPIPGTSEKSVVVASVTEIKIPQGVPVGSDKNDPYLGDANNMVVQNIVPQNNGIVTIVADTNWTNGGINVRISGAWLGDI